MSGGMEMELSPGVQALVNAAVFLVLTIGFAALVDWLMNNKDKRDQKGDQT